jgi:AcrR family transcriptional regulator
MMVERMQQPGRAQGTTPLPRGLDLLWGRRQAGKRGPKPALSVDAVVKAAIRLADAEGLEAVSMARVAQELGFTTMSIYRHVDNKEELLQLMWNASAEGVEAVVLEGASWREKLRAWAEVQRQALADHPWITEMPLAAPPAAPNSLAFVEKGLSALDGTALADGDKLRVIGILSSYTLSEARMANDAARAAKKAREEGEDRPPWDFHGLLRELVDEVSYPRLYRIAWEWPQSPDRSETEEFRFGVDRILDGVEALIERQQKRDRLRKARPARRRKG